MKEFIFTVVIGIIFILVLDKGLEKAEYAQCLKLKEQASRHVLFYLTPSEKEMCEYRGVEIFIK